MSPKRWQAQKYTENNTNQTSKWNTSQNKRQKDYTNYQQNLMTLNSSQSFQFRSISFPRLLIHRKLLALISAITLPREHASPLKIRSFRALQMHQTPTKIIPLMIFLNLTGPFMKSWTSIKSLKLKAKNFWTRHHWKSEAQRDWAKWQSKKTWSTVSCKLLQIGHKTVWIGMFLLTNADLTGIRFLEALQPRKFTLLGIRLLNLNTTTTGVDNVNR